MASISLNTRLAWCKKRRARLRGPHAPVDPLEYGVAQLAFHIVEDAAQAGLHQKRLDVAYVMERVRSISTMFLN